LKPRTRSQQPSPAVQPRSHAKPQDRGEAAKPQHSQPPSRETVQPRHSQPQQREAPQQSGPQHGKPDRGEKGKRDR
jgi:hypothetical protein